MYAKTQSKKRLPPLLPFAALREKMIKVQSNKFKIYYNDKVFIYICLSVFFNYYGGANAQTSACHF